MKHTAHNTPFLADAKRSWNAPIYRDVLRAYNDGGEIAAIRILKRHSTRWHEPYGSHYANLVASGEELSAQGMAVIAEEAVDAERYPHYRGKFDRNVRVRVKRNVTTKMGIAFVKGEISIGELRDPIVGEGNREWTVFSWRNAIGTILDSKDVEILD